MTLDLVPVSINTPRNFSGNHLPIDSPTRVEDLQYLKMKTKLLLTVASLACLLSIGSSAPSHSPIKREAQAEDYDYDYEEAIESTISTISQIAGIVSTIGNLFGGFGKTEDGTRERREAVDVVVRDYYGTGSAGYGKREITRREAEPQDNEDDDYDYEDTFSTISTIANIAFTIGRIFGGFRQPEELETRERREAVPVYLNDEKIQAFGGSFDEYNTGNNVAENEDKFIFTAQQPDY